MEAINIPSLLPGFQSAFFMATKYLNKSGGRVGGEEHHPRQLSRSQQSSITVCISATSWAVDVTPFLTLLHAFLPNTYILSVASIYRPAVINSRVYIYYLLGCSSLCILFVRCSSRSSTCLSTVTSLQPSNYSIHFIIGSTLTTTPYESVLQPTVSPFIFHSLINAGIIISY